MSRSNREESLEGVGHFKFINQKKGGCNFSEEHSNFLKKEITLRACWEKQTLQKNSSGFFIVLKKIKHRSK